jgi:uncharacterized protein (TIGR03083 family)
MPEITSWTAALEASHHRFVELVQPLSERELEQRSYAEDWSIAQTASHLGSQAEIFGLFLDAGLSGTAAPGGEIFSPIWDRWNALEPLQQATASIEANETLVHRISRLSLAQQDAFSLSLFGGHQDLAGLAAMRLSEHAVHTWDIAVALQPAATVSADAVSLLIDVLPATAARSGRPTTGLDPVPVATSEPDRTFRLTLSPAVALEPVESGGADPLRLPAEALLRLVYGRLDPQHTPDGVSDARLPRLREVFPGF